MKVFQINFPSNKGEYTTTRYITNQYKKEKKMQLRDYGLTLLTLTPQCALFSSQASLMLHSPFHFGIHVVNPWLPTNAARQNCCQNRPMAYATSVSITQWRDLLQDIVNVIKLTVNTGESMVCGDTVYSSRDKLYSQYLLNTCNKGSFRQANVTPQSATLDICKLPRARTH